MKVLRLLVVLVLKCFNHVELWQEACLTEEALLQMTTHPGGLDYFTSPVTPVLECSARCAESFRCSNFYVDTKSLTCYLYSNSSEKSQMVSDNTQREGSRDSSHTTIDADKRSESLRSAVCLTRRRNIALNRPTNQSTGHVWSPNRAVDGNRSMIFQDGHCSHTGPNPIKREWWRVDLGQIYDIQDIVIWNRADCCGERLSDFTVYVGNKSTTSDTVQYKTCVHHPGWFKGSKKLSCDQWSSGQFLKIEISRGVPLTLCEVEVFPKLCKSG